MRNFYSSQFQEMSYSESESSSYEATYGWGGRVADETRLPIDSTHERNTWHTLPTVRETDHITAYRIKRKTNTTTERDDLRRIRARREASFFDHRRRKMSRTTPSTSMSRASSSIPSSALLHQLNADEAEEGTDDEADFRNKKYFMSTTSPSTRKGLYEENANANEFEIIDKAEFNKMTQSSSKVRPSTNDYKNYDDGVEEVDEVFRFNTQPSSNIGFSTRRRLYREKDHNAMDAEYESVVESKNKAWFRKRTHNLSKIGRSTMKELNEGNSDEDTDSEEQPFEKIDKVDVRNNYRHFEYEKGSFTRQVVNEACDAANSARLRRKKIYQESVNDNITARQHEELSSGIASRTRSKTMSVKKSTKTGKFAMDLSDESRPSTDRGYDSSGSNDSEVKIAYVSDSTDSLSSYSEEDCVQNNIIIEETTKESEDCNEIERNSPTHVVSSDVETKECEKEKVPSSKESREKEDERNRALEENEEINAILSNNATLEEGLQVRSNGKGEGNSLNHVSNEVCNDEEEKECGEAGFEKQKASLPKKRNGEKARKINEIPEQNEKINRILADDVTAREKLQVKTNGTKKKSPTAPCSNQSHLAKDSSEADGVNRLQSRNQSRSNMWKQTKAVSPAFSEDKDCDYTDNAAQRKTDEANVAIDENEETVATEDKGCGYTGNGVQRKTDEANLGIDENGNTETIPANDEIEKRINKKLSSSRHFDLCRMLADSVLKQGPLIENESDDESKQAPTNITHITLPLKFRFEDEIPKETEKTESDVMAGDLFDELNLSWALVKLDTSKFPEVNSECECPPAEETEDVRCARGLHELILEDNKGLYCIYCHHVELEPRDIVPQWVLNTRRKSGRKRSSDSVEPAEFDELHVASSLNNDAAFNCSTGDGTVWNVKPGVRESMYKHQQEGFEFLWKNLAGSISMQELKNSKPSEVGGCIISHAPGTGKTRLTIVFIETYLKVFPDCRPVIIAPASMLLTWEEEFAKWEFPFPFHNLNNLEFLGNESRNVSKHIVGPKRQNTDTIRMVKIYSWNKGGSILGISYSLFEKLTGEKHVKDDKNKKSKSMEKFSNEKAENLRKILLEKPGLVILDEGHTPRNQRSNIWNSLLKLKTEKRVILSGTPFQNNFGELFNTLRLVRPAIANVLTKDKMFAEIITSRTRRRHKRKDAQSGSISEVIDGAVLEKLKSVMLPFVNVHKGTILRESLPGLRDCVILLKPQELQKSLIETLEGHPSTFEFEHKVALISVHPYLFKYCDSLEKRNLEIDLNLVEASKLNPNEGAKTKFIIELLRLSTVTNEKVLIFSQYIQPLELIKEQLKEVFKWVEGKQILRMEGKLDQKHRQNLINIYNNPLSEARVMLASTKCCSEGISLVGASRVVLLDVVWNPSVERQAICRAYRIGQKKFVYTYHLMTSGTTEGDKYCRQAEKERLSELVFCSSYGERDKNPQAAGCIEDRILEEMVGCAKSADMFEKIINQPKETDLIQTFGL